MTWSEHHTRSEKLAAEAEQLARQGRIDDATVLYRDAAEAETRALDGVGPQKAKTLGITSVSAVALWYKAREYQNAEELAHRWLGAGQLPRFAVDQLRTLLQTVWTTEAAARAGVRFVTGDVLVSVKGGPVVYGGAPLELIAAKVEEVKAFFTRIAEMLLELPIRRRGGPSASVQSVFQPWLFQVPAGSYQFAIRIQEPPQTEIFPDAKPQVEQVTETFLRIAKATSNDPELDLPEVVPDADYRAVFLKLARNLSPTGKSFEHLEIREAGSPAARPIYFGVASRGQINTAIRKERPVAPTAADEESVELRGTLRALHLDQDWIEVALASEVERHPRIYEVGEVMDDVIGPMVNRRVIVSAVRKANGRLSYRDIEPED